MNHFARLALAALAFAAVPARAAESPPASQDDTRPALERIKGTKLYVSDLARSVRFYSTVLGLKVAREIAEIPGKPVNEAIMTQSGGFDMGETVWLVLKVPRPAEGRTPRQAGVTGQFVVIARDVPGVAARARAAGARVRTFQHGITVIADPDGHQIEVLPAMSAPSSPGK